MKKVFKKDSNIFSKAKKYERIEHGLFKKADKIKKKNEKKEGKISRVMHEFKEGSLRSGSKMGPKVKNKKQAIAIAISEARRGKKK